MSPTHRRRLMLLIGIALPLALALAISGVYVARSSFPQVEGTLQVPGLRAPVDIYRDTFGVPHIVAEDEHDLFFAQGFVHAQDRFWQMDFWRHIGAGRLAEMFGDSQVDTDLFLRTLGWERIARQELEAMGADNRAIFEAYAEGVNAYLAQRQGYRLSLEYAILGLLSPEYEPAPWTPLHSLTWAKVMAWDLGGNLDAEIDRGLMLSQWSPDRVEQLYPPYPEDNVVIVPGTGSSALESCNLDQPFLAQTGIARALRTLEARLDGVAHARPATDWGLGSNNWVISGDRTATGMPLLANDTHLGIQMPSIWYEVGLHCRTKGPDCLFNVVGYSFAGVPAVIIGHNDRIAWGVTNVGPDVQDLVIEKINPDNPNQYEYNSEWVNMGMASETIHVAGSDPIELTVRSTRHGPIISDTYGPLEGFGDDSGVQVPAPYAVALRWTALEPSPLTDAVLGINRAQDWEQFRNALRDWTVPSQNFVYADIDGNIGYQMPGQIPIRAAGDGCLPVPGWHGDYGWSGYIPFEDLPFSFNPEQGYLVTANNPVVGGNYAHVITRDWDYGYRASRITQMIEAETEISMDSVQAFQADNHNGMAPQVLPHLLAVAQNDPDLGQVVRVLSDWSGQQNRDSSAAALYNAVWRHLLLATFSDELPDGPIPGGSRAFAVLSNLLDDPDSPWWDDSDTQQTENRDDILRRAIQDGLDELEAELGSDPGAWRWGNLHVAVFRNQSLGESGVAPIEALFNRGPFPVSGGTSIVNATSWSVSQGYEVTSLPSQRLIVDFDSLDRSLTIHTTGQSGHAYHPHYVDMAEPWSRIEYHPLLWSLESVLDGAASQLRLEPPPGGD